jgi:enoyl-CoA hydratase/carnithine racemase
VGLLIVDRPAVRNALDWEAMAALAAAVEQAWQTPELCALIVTGAGGQAFISGGDLRALHNHTTEADGHRQHDLMSGALARLEALPVPVIAAIEGAARAVRWRWPVTCVLPPRPLRLVSPRSRWRSRRVGAARSAC